MSEDSAPPTGPDLTKGIPLADIPKDGMLAGHVDKKPVILSRVGNDVVAVSGACSHYHAPLADGLVRDGMVHCPWHHACFDLRTGEAVGAPAFDPLDRYAVTVKDGQVTVGDVLEPEPMPKPPKGAPQRIVIVGGGAAGFAAAEMLRRLGYAGTLTMLSASEDPPVDRPNLSKDYLVGNAPADWIPLKPTDFYAEKKIDLHLKTEVTDIDLKTRTAVTAKGEKHPFDALLLATGAEPIHLKTPGFDKPNVYALRSLADSTAIVEAVKNAKRVAVIGASFIGLEVAASLRARKIDVHVVAPEDLPLHKVLGVELGRHVRDLHSKKGVIFHLGQEGKDFDGKTLTLSDGSKIEVDAVIQGVGVKPNVALAEKIGLKVDKGVIVDAHFRTSDEAVFAVGDIARYPDALTGELSRVEHWVAAQRQAQVAAANMLGQKTTWQDPPFFWSQHYDTTIRYTGHAADWDRSTVDGSVDDGDCTVRYYKGDKLLAAASVGRDVENLKIEGELEKAAAK